MIIPILEIPETSNEPNTMKCGNTDAMLLKPPEKLAKIVNSHFPYTPFKDMQIRKYVKHNQSWWH